MIESANARWWLAALLLAPILAPPRCARAAEGEHDVQVWALTYTERADGVGVGNCVPLGVTVTRAASRAFRVGFFESEVGGSGPSWRASGWTAAMVAALVSPFDLTATQIAYDLAGNVDGPSAGAVMTIGTIAALRGDRVREDAAMTGTINPDGTIGPVGGLQAKLDGAADAGKRLVLIPAVARRVKLDPQGDAVDLVAHGKSRGLTVRSVRDVYEAYELMTGKRLPAPPEADHPVLDEASYDLLSHKAQEWQYKAKLARDRTQAIDEAHRAEISLQYLEQAEELILRVDGLLDEGQAAAAYQTAGEAWTLAQATQSLSDLRRAVAEGGREKGEKFVRSALDDLARIDTVVARAAQLKPRTVAQVGTICEALAELCGAMACVDEAKSFLPFDWAESATDDDVLRVLSFLLLKVETGAFSLAIAEDDLEFAAALAGEGKPANLRRLQYLADLYQRAADANHAMFERQVVDELVEHSQLEAERVRIGLSLADPSYGMMRQVHETALPRLLEKLGPGDLAQCGRLGVALDEFARGAELLAKFYALNAEYNNDMALLNIPREKTLQNMLDAGEDRLRRAVGLLTRHGVQPLGSIEAYDRGRIYRERDSQRKLFALRSYWQGCATAQALISLSEVELPK